MDVQSKGLLPADLYATGTFTAILDLAKYYNGKPTEDPLDKGGNEGGFAETKPTKVFSFYRAYTK